MIQTHDFGIHHNAQEFIVRIIPDDDDDCEIIGVRVPSDMEGAHESQNLVGWIDQVCPEIFEEMQELAMTEYRGWLQMRKEQDMEDK